MKYYSKIIKVISKLFIQFFSLLIKRNAEIQNGFNYH